MIKEISCGIIPVMYEKGSVRFLLVFHRGGKHWGFPKGKKDEGESDLETATRELREETGLEVVRFISQDPLIENYTFYKRFQRVRKTAIYFPAEVFGNLQKQEEEILEARWFSCQEAIERLSFQEAKEMCQKVHLFISKDPLCQKSIDDSHIV